MDNQNRQWIQTDYSQLESRVLYYSEPTPVVHEWDSETSSLTSQGLFTTTYSHTLDEATLRRAVERLNALRQVATIETYQHPKAYLEDTPRLPKALDLITDSLVIETSDSMQEQDIPSKKKKRKA